MTRVTRDVPLDRVRDLLARAPRACVCVASDDGPEAFLVRLSWTAGRLLISVPRSSATAFAPGREAVVLVDEGIAWYELRAVYIRGVVHVLDAALAPTLDASEWFEVVPTRVVAWDYGELRRVDDAP